MLWDAHTHTCFSGDSDASMAAMIASAQAHNLTGICFTDHMDMDYPGEPTLFLLDIPKYQSAVRSLQQQYEDTFAIHCGIELGLQPQLATRHRELLEEYDFDFVIGSSHIVHGLDPYDPPFFQNKTQEEAYREYFISIHENILAFDAFDVYGHLDYVVRYGPTKNKSYSYQQYADIIDTILKLLIEKGKGIEVNTAGFKYGLHHPNPTEDIIRRYHELGGEIITIGSDAHRPEHIAYDFEKIPELLKEAGFRYYTVFENRKPKFLPL